ncbi:MAG: ATP-binding cassette domain-containing protein [Bacteroidales bacterium]|nr:ATP-binding cassette domain-containing protein [Bacteroidales bacterium]
MITIRNIRKSFNKETVLNDISVDFDEGKTNLVIGQSGSGKTVLVKCIIGLFEVDEGEIFYHNRDIVRMTLRERQALRREMGKLFQGGALFDSLTVEENVRFPLDMFTSMTAGEKRKQVDFCLDHVRLDTAHKLFPAELSGGMQKRAAIARAIVQNPRYLFCDEPNSGLDPITAIVIDKLISEITHEFNMTTIINTHDMNSVMEIGEKVVFIHKGIKQWEGNSEGVLTSDNEYLNDFVFASNLTKKIKEKL